jgi:hypothetical protein
MWRTFFEVFSQARSSVGIEFQGASEDGAGRKLPAVRERPSAAPPVQAELGRAILPPRARPFIAIRKTMTLRKATHRDFSRGMKSEAVSIKVKSTRRRGSQGRIALTHHTNEIR